MSFPLPPWLLSHLGSGVLLGGVLLAVLLTWKRGSAAQRCCVIGVFLAAMVVAAPLQRAWWPEIAIPVKREAAVESVTPPLILDQPAEPVMLAVTDMKPSDRVMRPVSAPISFGLLLGVIWAMGAGLLLLRLAAGWWQWRRLWTGARARQKPAALDSSVEVRVSEAIRVPMSSGCRILMPEDWLRWPRRDQAAALEHELAHWRHRDGFSRWMAALATALHWPSPLVWMAERRLRLAQEQCCDEAVLRSGVDAVLYGQLLMRCAKRIGPRHPWLPATVATMARPAQLAQRIEHLAGGTKAQRPARWCHVLWPLLLACACVQALHLRLAAEPLPPGAGEAHRVEMITLEVKIITSLSGLPQKLLPSGDGAGKIHKLAQTEFTTFLRELLRDEKTEVVSYPRMVSSPDREVIVRNVVSRHGEMVTLEDVGRAGVPWSGTILSLISKLHADGIELNGGIGFNREIKELDDVRSEHEGQKIMIEGQRVAAGGTLVLGPLAWGPPKENGERPQVWTLITARHIDAAPDEAQEKAAAALRQAPARSYDIAEQSWRQALLRLATDAGIQMAVSDVPDGGDDSVKLLVTSSPFAVMEQICAKHRLRLSYQDGMWLVHSALLGGPDLGPPADLPKDSHLRTQPARRYEMNKALLDDVIRFVATDAGISFIGLPEDAVESQKLVTFSFNASPFTVLENICRLHHLDLSQEDGIWCMRRRTDEEKQRAAAAARLRATPPNRYDFSRALLGDVLRYLAKDAGLTISVPENDKRMNALVTFSITAAPYSVLETLCRSNGARLEFREGLWRVR